MSIASVMPSSCLILWHPLLLLPSILPSIRDFSSESAVCIRWPKNWSFNFGISPSNMSGCQLANENWAPVTLELQINNKLLLFVCFHFLFFFLVCLMQYLEFTCTKNLFIHLKFTCKWMFCFLSGNPSCMCITLFILANWDRKMKGKRTSQREWNKKWVWNLPYISHEGYAQVSSCS